MSQAAGLRRTVPGRGVPVPEPLAGTSPFHGSPAASGTGPWTVRSWGAGTSARSWVTAVCTVCGAMPCDEDLGMYASFASIEQAREELPRDWGWPVLTLPGRPEQVLCPGCAAPRRVTGESTTDHL